VIAVLKELLDRSELQRRGFTTVVALTYGVNLPWFEHHLGRQLRIAGIRRFALFADARALDASLTCDADELDGAGTWYSIIGVHLKTAFHPKVLLLTGPNAARLYVGSGNLNPSGLGQNLEIFERWDASLSDGAVDRVFEDLRRYLDQILVRLRSPLVHIDDVLREAFGQPVLRQPRREGAARIHGGLPGSTGTLLDSLPLAPSPAHELIMTTPFFDAKGELAVDLANHFGAQAFEVIVDLGMTNLTADARTAIEAAGGRIRAFADDRVVHAKAVFASGDGWKIGIHGSANLSNAAWRGHNAEIIVTRRGESANEIARLLRTRPVREISENEWEDLAKLTALEQNDRLLDWDPSLVILSATRSAETIEIIVPKEDAAHAASLTCRTSMEVFTLATESPATGLRRASLGGRVVESSVVVRLESGASAGPWTVVHDVAVLRSHTRPRSPFDDDAVDYLGGPRSADSTEALLELLSAIAEERRERGNDPIRTSRETPKDDPEEEWVWVTAADFRDVVSAPGSDVAPHRVDADGRPDPARLLTRLLFGDSTQRDQPARDVEDGGDQDAGDGSPPAAPSPKKTTPVPVRDLGKLVERTQRAYLQRLLRAETTAAPARLLHELVILVATFQDAARQGSISDRQLAGSLVTLTDAILGDNAAPLPRSLHSVPLPSRADTWICAPIVAAASLAIYNTCLVNAVVANEAPADSTFSDARAMLWLRNVLRYTPWSDPSHLLEHIEQHLPWIRRFSVLWVADRWPYWDGLLPFEEFVRDGIHVACHLERLDAILRKEGNNFTYRADDEDIVVGLGRDQRLAAGFLDSDDDTPNVVLFDGAFQRPDAHDQRRRPLETKTSKVRSLSQIVTILRSAGGSSADIDVAIKLLRQLADR
jgi:hypothetical protein